MLAAAEARSRRGSTSARDNSLSNGSTERFIAWATVQGQSFSSTREFSERLSAWNATDKIIEDTNAKALASGDRNAVKLKHNQFSAWTVQEREQLYGLKNMETRRDGGSVSGRDRRGGRNLAMTASAVDWAANGKTGPVKDQGACGSCYTFASNTVLEATLSIEQGIEYRRLSEQ